MTNLAPIVLFVYNRPSHAEQTLYALYENKEAKDSVLYIYADGPKGDASAGQQEKITQTRSILRAKQWCKEVKIFESENNKGLADSIIDGVTRVVNEHGRVIVLEDDIVTSKGFLKFMNEALVLYENEDKVMHISGYMLPVKGRLPETFFSKIMFCWGWATWKHSWDHLSINASELISKIKSIEERKQFDLFGAMNYYSQLEANFSGLLKTWAVKWYASIYFKDGLCLNPSVSLIDNIGIDGTGENCNDSNIYSIEEPAESIPVKKIPIIESELANNTIRKFQLQLNNQYKGKATLKSKIKSLVHTIIKK